MSSGRGGDPQFAISDADWERIERALGKQLSADVRKTVHEATERFILFEPAERTAEPVADAEAIIKACKKSASNFQRTLQTHAFKSSDAAIYATGLIRKNFQDSRLDNEERLFNPLSGLLTSFHVACIEALKELNDPEFPFLKGNSWKLWIRRLTKIMQDAGLPWQARKDSDKAKHDRPSPFTAFVWELQKYLPTDCRYPYAISALPTAIKRARAADHIKLA
jgi:hypothetical protein